MTINRSNDCVGSTDFPRSDRVFHDDDSGLWFFRTREGKHIGPFRYRAEAEEMLTRFINSIAEAHKKESSTQKLHFRMSAVARGNDNLSPSAFN